ARPAQRRGRLPGHVPGAGEKGRLDPRARRPGGLAVPSRSTGRDPGQCQLGPAARVREAGRTDDSRDLNTRTSPAGRLLTGSPPGACPAAREISSRRDPLRPGRHSSDPGRPAIALERADVAIPTDPGARTAQAPTGPPRPDAG